MSPDTREQRLMRRIDDLYANDPQFAAARPNSVLTAEIDQFGLRLPQIVRTALDGYAKRPAIAQRAVHFTSDPQTGRVLPELLPCFETISYSELWDRLASVASAFLHDRIRPGDAICFLGFASVDYTTVDLALTQIGAVAVPLPTSASVTQLRPIVIETEPSVIAASVDYVADAVELALTGRAPQRLIVFDYYPEVDDHREALAAAGARLAQSSVIVETLAEVIERGRVSPSALPVVASEQDPLALLIYTSGSTGIPKGVMYPEHLVANTWRTSGRAAWGQENAEPAIVLALLPMSHGMGRGILYWTLASGGTAYFAAAPDLSTFFEDLALARPTQLAFVPRIWEMLYQHFQWEVSRRCVDDGNRAAVVADVMADMRQTVLGGRFIWAMVSGSAISTELKTWAESLLDMRIVDGYGSTEAGAVLLDGHIRRPPVTAYKVIDVPELGYSLTDHPHPRGELLIKSDHMFAGYHKRPDATVDAFDADGYYRTGDIVAEVGPGRLVYLDRRNNVLKLAQGEFITVAKLEAVFCNSPLVRQIYVYGNSAHAHLLAVVVPTEEALARHDAKTLKPAILSSLHNLAKGAGLHSFEVPRDFIIETMPFTLENGLLTGIRKLARPKLKAHYGERLEQIYADLADGQANQPSELRRSGADAPLLQTVSRAAAATLGAAAIDLPPDSHFTDLGGDSLSALAFGNLLREIFDIDVPVGVIVSPANDLAAIAEYIEGQRQGTKRPTFASVHGRDAVEVHASDLALDKFIDAATLAAAPTLARPSAEVRTVLLTGATGFLGRYLALEWLERMDLVDGKVIALVRATSEEGARARLDDTFNSGDPKLWAHYQRLAAGHLEVIAGDKGEANLGLDDATWHRLADTVDIIVDPAALVNHVLPYSELFGPNVLGTAELIRIALTSKQKPYIYVSTIGVGGQIQTGKFVEDADIRQISATRAINDNYANGYGNSKWAGEVLLREAHDLCGLPVTVFRCDMILADTTYAGQLNLPDTFTRLILSLAATGIAPPSFYELDVDGSRQRASHNGLPVEFVAEAVSTLGAPNLQSPAGLRTYHVMNPHDDGIGLDEVVDWLINAGCPIQRTGDYAEWLHRFETLLRHLPQRQRRYSLLPLLRNYQNPQKPISGSAAPTNYFRAAASKAKIGHNEDIPGISPPIVVKYINDLRLLGLL
ncbi:MAG: carboxylic acid reductase [Mycobacterium sp.]|nr:carboxylic acid reductase [Mycobacterium sp.]